ncbi:MAG: hypothetical protein FWD74_12445, partial [Actinomycetia bacterium]|nr:hypothetical protein [Actinomycetes bacterium]
GGVDPADLPDPALALAALDKVGFLVSLELRASAVTERADVVLPVAPIAEKAGRFVNWEGRRRPFDLTVTNAGALADHRVLDKLAGALEAPLGLPTVDAVRAELARLDGAARPAKLAVPAAPAPVAPSAGQAVLATWAELIDAGRMSDGEDSLAATARPARAVLSAATAEAAGLACGDAVTVSTERGAITVPAQVRDDIIDGVVWLPANARGCAVRASLGGGSGDVVRVAPATKAEPVAGEAAEGVAPDEVFASVERAEPAEEAETNTATAGGDQ